MKVRQHFLLLIILTAALSNSTTTQGKDREDALRSDITAAFEIVLKAERGGVDVEGFVAGLNEALELIEDGRTAKLDLAETKIAAIIASAPEIDEKIASITMFRWIKVAFILLILTASAFLARRYGPKTFWTLWHRVMQDWTVHP